MLTFLWSDFFIWLIFLSALLLFWRTKKNPLLSTACASVQKSPQAMASFALLLVFVFIALLDSVHFKPQIKSISAASEVAYAIEIRSLLDSLFSATRQKIETSYSAPFATRSFAKEAIETDTGISRDFPLLKYGGAHLKNENDKWGDILQKLSISLLATFLVLALFFMILSFYQARCHQINLKASFFLLIKGKISPSFRPIFLTYSILLLFFIPLFYLNHFYHVFGTDKVGQDVFFQVLKSIRTGFLIGILASLMTLPIAITLGLFSGYFQGWIDDVIQYLYTTLSSIPGVLLLAAFVLLMQGVIDTHPEWFDSTESRADIRLLSLCAILGMTSWTSLCRLLRGETLKLRSLDYVIAAKTFGVSHFKILFRHILPNLAHLIIIALAMDFSGLVLAEAVLSYIGIGVAPSTMSFGTLINNARSELSREPVIWWSLSAAFVFMLALVLSANLFADALREAFDPRNQK